MKSKRQKLHLEKVRQINLTKKRTGKNIKCKTCGKKFYVYKSRIKQAENRGHKTQYCSRKCYPADGENNYFWKNGRYKEYDGYIRVWTKDGLKKEHRNLVEKRIGRKLRKDEVIHHINGIRDDNRFVNLRIMNVGEHHSYHNKKGKKKKLTSNICPS